MKKSKKVREKDIIEVLKKAKKIAIFGHVLPDGDCLGSIYGMKLALESADKDVFAYIDDKIPYYLEFLKDYEKIKNEDKVQDVDMVFVFDSSSINMVGSGEMLRAYKDKKIPIYQIDHHVQGSLNDFVDYSWQDQKFSSTSEMVLLIIKEMNILIKKEIATLLLTGIEGDTGSFQHQNTTEKSLEAAAYLMSKGARLKQIVDNTINSKKELNVLKLYGLALERLIYNKKYKTVASYLTLEDARKFGIEGESYSEVVNFFNIIGTVKMIILITERAEGTLKVSLRTRNNDVDVQKLASRFGGGGHVKASGFSIKGKIIKKDGQVRVV